MQSTAIVGFLNDAVSFKKSCEACHGMGLSPRLKHAEHDSHCFQAVLPLQLSVVLSALSLSLTADVYQSMHLLQPFGSCFPSDTFKQSSLLCLTSGPWAMLLAPPARSFERSASTSNCC